LKTQRHIENLNNPKKIINTKTNNVCVDCDMSFCNSSSLKRHLDSLTHKQIIEKIKVKNNNVCIPCSYVFGSPSELKRHLETKTHKNTLEKLGLVNELEKLEKNSEIVKANSYCKDCDIYLTSPAGLKRHLETLKHKKVLERLDILKNINNHSFCSIPMRNNVGDIVDHVIVDNEIYSMIIKYPIYKDTNGYANIIINNIRYLLHRYIYYDLSGKIPTPNTIIDHRDHNKLNDKLENLTETTYSVNASNRTKKENGASKYRGVSASHGCWSCSLKYNNVFYSFRYKDESHAAYHYDLLIKELKLEYSHPINHIEMPTDFIIKSKFVRKYDLPKNIHHTGSKFSCQFKGKLKDKSKYAFISIEEAVIYRDTILAEVKEKKKLHKEQTYEGIIDRNVNNIAIIKVFNKKGYFCEVLLDDNDYCRIKHNNYTLHILNTYILIYAEGKKHLLSRWIMNCTDKMQVDHADNRKHKLRVITQLQNAQNRRANKNSSSKYVGVSYSNTKWQSAIQGKYLGRFKTEEEAVLVRNKRAKELNDLGAFYKIETYVPT
jgi:hypothetical protein